jgi:hypothetical protein
MKTSVTTSVGNPRARTLRILAAAGIVLAAWAGAARADWPDTPVEGLVSGSADSSSSGTVGMDGEGRFIVSVYRPARAQAGAQVGRIGAI